LLESKTQMTDVFEEILQSQAMIREVLRSCLLHEIRNKQDDIAWFIKQKSLSTDETYIQEVSKEINRYRTRLHHLLHDMALNFGYNPASGGKVDLC
jgi:hypothetical protein